MTVSAEELGGEEKEAQKRRPGRGAGGAGAMAEEVAEGAAAEDTRLDWLGQRLRTSLKVKDEAARKLLTGDAHK